MNRTRKQMFLTLPAICLLAVLLPCTRALAQDETPSPTPVPDEQQAQQDLTLQNNQVPATTQDQLPPVDEQSYDKVPVNLATGQLLRVTRSPLRWGHFSILSFNAIQVYDSNYLFRQNDRLSAQAGAVQGLLVYAIKTGRMNFSAQYRPQVWLSSESTQVDYASHLLDMHVSRRVSSKWSINFSDRYQWAADRGNLDQIGLSADYVTSNVNQNPFLVGGRRLISNIADFAVGHNFTAHNSLDFSARHQYVQLSNLPVGSNIPDPVATQTRQQIFGGQVGWTHQWSHNNSVGIHYAYDREFFEDFSSSAQFHSVLFGFSRRLTPSLVLQMSGGPSVMLPAKPQAPLQPQEIRQTYQAAAALFKTFHRAAFTLSYSRNDDFTGQINDGLNDRVGLTYTERFFRRLDLVVGGAYVRQNYLSGAHLLGTTGWTEINYHLSPSWSFYSTYSYLTQGGGTTIYGPRYLVTSGIRWSWDAGRTEGYGR